ncbi:hypothetical protein GCM10027346_05120 [Hymenobacter seoulensis]
MEAKQKYSHAGSHRSVTPVRKQDKPEGPERAQQRPKRGGKYANAKYVIEQGYRPKNQEAVVQRIMVIVAGRRGHLKGARYQLMGIAGVGVVVEIVNALVGKPKIHEREKPDENQRKRRQMRALQETKLQMIQNPSCC